MELLYRSQETRKFLEELEAQRTPLRIRAVSRNMRDKDGSRLMDLCKVIERG